VKLRFCEIRENSTNVLDLTVLGKRMAAGSLLEFLKAMTVLICTIERTKPLALTDLRWLAI